MFSKRQSEIIEKSIEIIAHKGIQGLTIKNLSKEIGISEPAIYRHFDSKTAILVALLSTFEDMADMMNMLMQNSQDTAIEKIEFIFSRMTEVFEETPSLVSVIFSEEIFKNEKVLLEKITLILNKNEETIHSIIKMGQEKGEIRTDIYYKNISLMFMGSLRLLVKKWDINHYNFSLKEEGKSFIQSLKKIISTTPQ
ncbi:MAG: TetR family transcriptional regulator [Bacteroidetes bacterium 4572_77]|nr:MAG: TetR family transcriptional regulator [Bacteroidetes bacterium 4572_77]